MIRDWVQTLIEDSAGRIKQEPRIEENGTDLDPATPGDVAQETCKTTPEGEEGVDIDSGTNTRATETRRPPGSPPSGQTSDLYVDDDEPPTLGESALINDWVNSIIDEALTSIQQEQRCRGDSAMEGTSTDGTADGTAEYLAPGDSIFEPPTQPSSQTEPLQTNIMEDQMQEGSSTLDSVRSPGEGCTGTATQETDIEGGNQDTMSEVQDQVNDTPPLAGAPSDVDPSTEDTGDPTTEGPGVQGHTAVTSEPEQLTLDAAKPDLSSASPPEVENAEHGADSDMPTTIHPHTIDPPSSASLGSSSQPALSLRTVIFDSHIWTGELSSSYLSR